MTTSSFDGKVAIVTGASSGIGAATAIAFAKNGCSLALTGRNEQKLLAVKQKCVEVGLSENMILCHLGDITDKTTQDLLVQKTVEKFGKINILINNAGIVIPGSPSGNQDPIKMEDFDKIMETNVKSLVSLSMLCLPFLKDNKGNIVNVSSVSAFNPMANRLFYCMSKAAVDMFTKCMALELAPQGVRVNSVNPGPVATNIHSFRGEEGRKFLESLAAKNPSGRNGTAEEVAEVILFLSSDKAPFITGVVTPVDGGISL